MWPKIQPEPKRPLENVTSEYTDLKTKVMANK